MNEMTKCRCSSRCLLLISSWRSIIADATDDQLNRSFHSYIHASHKPTVSSTSYPPTHVPILFLRNISTPICARYCKVTSDMSHLSAKVYEFRPWRRACTTPVWHGSTSGNRFVSSRRMMPSLPVMIWLLVVSR